MSPNSYDPQFSLDSPTAMRMPFAFQPPTPQNYSSSAQYQGNAIDLAADCMASEWQVYKMQEPWLSPPFEGEHVENVEATAFCNVRNDLSSPAKYHQPTPSQTCYFDNVPDLCGEYNTYISPNICEQIEEQELKEPMEYLQWLQEPFPPKKVDTTKNAAPLLEGLPEYDPSASVDFANCYPTDSQPPSAPAESQAGPITIIQGEEPVVLPGIVEKTQGHQNVTYWIPLDPLSPSRHYSVSQAAQQRGQPMDSIASILVLFSDNDGMNEIPCNPLIGDENHSGPLLEVDLFDSRYAATSERLHKNKTKRVKRPLNSFMIYRRSQTQRVMLKARQFNIKLDHKTISSVIGLLWQTESAKVQSYFIQLSTVEKSRHHRLFPDYRFQPRRKYGSEKSVSASKTPKC